MHLELETKMPDGALCSMQSCRIEVMSCGCVVEVVEVVEIATTSIVFLSCHV